MSLKARVLEELREWQQWLKSVEGVDMADCGHTPSGPSCGIIEEIEKSTIVDSALELNYMVAVGDLKKKLIKYQNENRHLKNYLKDHFIETCPDIYCGKRDEREQCEKCAEKWIQDILKRVLNQKPKKSKP